jgi:hypothetical protein
MDPLIFKPRQFAIRGELIFGRNCHVKCRDISYIEGIAYVGFSPNFGNPSVGDIVPLSQSLVAEWGQHCMQVGSNFGCNFSI